MDISTRLVGPRQAPVAARPATIAGRIERLSPTASWKPVKQVRLQFNTFHPQGMVKVGNEYWMTSVEVKGGWFRKLTNWLHLTTKTGVGHLFRFNQQGKLLGELKLGEGAMYHTGGIDYDGKYLWIPAAEYRPNSNSIVYRVDPTTMKAEEAFRFPDHLGAVSRDPQTNTLNAVSWSGEKLYTWKLDAQDRPIGAPKVTANDHRSVDYQDMHHLPGGLALASGYRGSQGGMDLLDLRSRTVLKSLPVPVSVGDMPMTRNPFWVERAGGKLQFSFVPQDNRSSMFVYDVATN